MFGLIVLAKHSASYTVGYCAPTFAASSELTSDGNTMSDLLGSGGTVGTVLALICVIPIFVRILSLLVRFVVLLRCVLSVLALRSEE